MLDFFIFWGGQTVHSVHFIKNRPVWSPESPPSLQELLRRRLQLLYSLGKTKWLEIPPSTRIGLPKTRDQISICLASNSWLSLKLFGKKHGPGPFWFFSRLPNRSNSFQLPGDENLRIWPLPKCPRTHLEALHLPTWPWNVTLKHHPGVPKKKKTLPDEKLSQEFASKTSFPEHECHECHFHVMNEGKQWLNLDKFLKLEKTPLHFSHQQGLLRSQVCMQRPLWSWRSGTWDRVGGLFMDALVQNMVEYV